MSLALYERSTTLYAAWKRRGSDKCLRWMPCENGAVPEGAIEVGRLGGRGGEPLYIGRMTQPNNDTIPGTIIPSRNACYAAWKGRELEAADYEVLVNTKPDGCYIHWTDVTVDGGVPHDAVKGGLDAENEALIYIARARPPGSFGTHAGQFREGDTTAKFSLNGSEFHATRFKLLCRRFIYDPHHSNYRPFTC